MNLDFEKMDGLIPAIIQDNYTQKVLMLGFMNEEAYQKTIESGKVTFFSRTKNRLWTKGEESGNFLNVIDIKAGYEDFVFISKRGKNISRIMVFHIIKELSAQVGLKKTISPHTFRHSFATHLLEGGANLRAIQCMLGHENIGTTEIYTHIDKHRLRYEIIEHHPRNKRNLNRKA